MSTSASAVMHQSYFFFKKEGVVAVTKHMPPAKANKPKATPAQAAELKASEIKRNNLPTLDASDPFAIDPSLMQGIQLEQE